MGVGGGFWQALTPYKREEDMEYLRGRSVAVDLSFWIVAVRAAGAPTLRTIFFRTISLFSKMGALPVFVVDGVPSLLKAKDRSDSRCVDDCVKLLGDLGMPVLHAKGEAEALCAQLNREGKVDACITSDSDAFLYGAKTVIKDFKPNSDKPFECYNVVDIQHGIGLSRKRMIAMALLIGTDYDKKGVPGMGRHNALRFVQLFDEDSILDKLREIGKGIYPDAASISRCFDKARDMGPQNWLIEVCGRVAARANFPNEEIIELYLCDDNLNTELRDPPIQWNEPNVQALFDTLTFGKLKESDIQRHMLPMLSTIYLRDMALSSASKPLFGHYEFHSVHEIRKRNGLPCYYVRWKRQAGLVVSDDLDTIVHTKENIQLVHDAFPDEKRKWKWLPRLKGEKSTPKVKLAKMKRVQRPEGERSRFELEKMKGLHGPKEEKSTCVQLSIKDFYRSKKP